MLHDFPANALPGGATPANLEAFARAGGKITIIGSSDQRAQGVTTTPRTLSGVAASIGLTDSQKPSTRRVEQSLVGLFMRLVELRATARASALLGGRMGAGFQVERIIRQGEYEPVEGEHPWATLLHDPSPHVPALELWTWAFMAEDLYGEAAFVIEDDARGVPTALHPIYPEFGTIEPVPSAIGGVGGFVYWRADGERILLEARDVVRIRTPHPSTPYRTMTLLGRAAYLLDKGLYADIYERDMLKDGRMPPSYVSSDQDLSTTQIDRYQAGLKKYMGTGAGKVKNVPVFGSGMKLMPTPFKAEDVALIESGILNDKRLFWSSGVPQGMVDHEANRANTDGQRRVFSEQTVQPLSDRAASQLTFGFARAFGSNRGVLRIISPSVVPIDRELQTRIDEGRIRSGTPINRIMAERGEETVEGGDVPLISGNLRTLQSVVTPREPRLRPSPGNNNPPPSDDADDEPEPETEGDEEREVRTRRTMLRLIGHTRAARIALSEDTLDEEWQAVHDERSTHFGPVEAAMLGVFERQATDVSARLLALGGRRADTPPDDLSVETVFDLGEWIAATQSELGPMLAETLRSGWDTGSLRISLSTTFDGESDAVKEALRRVIDKMQDVTETTRDQISGALSEGLSANESLSELSSRVRTLFDDMKASRADTIAQTSATSAFEAGQLEAFTEAGATKMWLTQRSGTSRPAHAAADGQEVAADEPFIVGGEEMMYPGDPNGSAANVIRCECTMLPGLPGDERTLTPAQQRAQEVRELYPEYRNRYGRDGAYGELGARFDVSPHTIRGDLGHK